jgi:DHA1 family purine ribonucleoside efflux pump-like MFS transporter
VTNTTTSTQLQSGPKPASWSGVVALSLGIFALVTAEFLPASLLPRIAEDLGVSSGAAGQSVTATAVAAALSALLLPVVLPQADRRRLMLGLTLLAAVSNLLVALAPSLPVVMASRLLLGVALGGFWALATAMAASLVPTDHIGRALTVINTGVSAATVAAVPLGAWLGEILGWRAAFFLAAGAAALALIAQGVTLPSVKPDAASGIKALGLTLRSAILLFGLVAILGIYSGHFTGFTYIRPAVEGLSDLDADGLAVLLFVFGVATVIGTAASGPLADRRLRLATSIFPAALGAGMLVMVATAGSTIGLFSAAVLWGIGFGGTPTAVLTWGARTEPTRLEQVGGLIVTVVQLAIGTGAVVGGLLVDSVSTSAPLLVGGAATVIGGVLLTALRQHDGDRRASARGSRAEP